MIKLPVLFQNKLESTPELAAAVHKNLALFGPWLESSGMPFFPEFTDHGHRHINEVLETAASMLSDSSQKLINPRDVAVLCIAALLHDCGMHLTTEGFKVLISESDSTLISGLGDIPWNIMWKDFLSEAQRFSQEKLIAIFGESTPIKSSSIDVNNLTERDRYLVGEFVRRHHARLAHEIAINGVPHTTDNKLILEDLDEEIKDLAGLVARSHGMPMRSTFEYIENNYGLIPEQSGVKTPFLMAVLRIADYLQVRSERAISTLLKVKELRSPISRQEWLNHFSVREVSTRHSDPEAIYVRVRPKDVKTYLRFDALFKDIQRELDESWATIGEVYGRQDDLASLGLTVRRIRSNFDSIEQFSKSIKFIPVKARFDSSGPDLLKLLVGPLYNYSYEVGIRELVQNAVDACRELYDRTRRSIGSSNINNSTPNVVVTIEESEDGAGWVEVTDYGIGMSLDTIINYYLIAGASFRNSDVWKRNHIDEDGRVHVLRGGRFGVGALAAFLLGDEIHVKTRHVDKSEHEGIEFTARIDDSIVELRHCNHHIGTTIRIRVSDPEIINSLRPPSIHAKATGTKPQILSWWNNVDWFLQSFPNVEYRWDGYNRSEDHIYAYIPRFRYKGKFHTQVDNIVPLPNENHPKWNLLPIKGMYDAILWSYDNSKRKGMLYSIDGYYGVGAHTVNGIRIGDFYGSNHNARITLEKEFVATPRYSVYRPSLAIFDSLGICPLNLQRNSISFERMGIDLHIAKDVIRKHLVGFRSANHPHKSLYDIKNMCLELCTHPGFRFHGQIWPICATLSNYFLATSPFFVSNKIKTLFIIDSKFDNKSPKISNILKEDEAIIIKEIDYGVQAALAWFRGIFSDDNQHTTNAGLPCLKRNAQISIMPTSSWELANQKGRVNREIISSLKCDPYNESHVLVSSGPIEVVNKLSLRAKAIYNALSSASEVTAWSIHPDQPDSKNKSLIYSIWCEVFGST